MKRKSYLVKRGLAIMLSVAMMLGGMDMKILAAEDTSSIAVSIEEAVTEEAPAETTEETVEAALKEATADIAEETVEKAAVAEEAGETSEEAVQETAGEPVGEAPEEVQGNSEAEAVGEDEISEYEAIAYDIYTAADLLTVRNDLSGIYTLHADIDLTGEDEWTPIGTGTGKGESFSGVFDGQGHTISGVHLSGSGYSYSGLFGVVVGTVKNLNVEITITDAQTAGGMVGYLYGGTVDCCSASGSIAGSADIGGLVGCFENGTIKNSYSMTAVTSSSETEADGCGGLVGDMYGNTNVAKISCSYAAGKVVKTGTTGVGGLVGYRHTHNYYGDGKTPIEACYYDLTTTKMGDECKGFGVTSSVLKIQNSFVGWDFNNIWDIDASVNNGYPYLKLTGPYTTYSLSGAGTKAEPFIITTEDELAALARREITSDENAYYKLGNDIKLTSSYWTPIGYDSKIPFAGEFDGDGYTISGLDIAFPGNYEEGLFGNVTGSIKRLNVIGNISDANIAGMLVGYLYGGTVDCCSASGSITGKGDIGGLVGYLENGSIKNSYAVTDVKNTSSNEGDGCGGLVGDMYGNTTVASISCSYAAGKVVKTGTSGVGGLVGYRHIRNYYGDGKTPITASYYNFSTTKMGDEGSGFGIKSADMKKQVTFMGWDFENIWDINASKNSGYPYLKLTGEYQIFDLDGSGTSRDPYIITSEEELAAIARGELTNNFTAYYKLGNDIVLTSSYWTPIGSDSGFPFAGEFDGDGHTISGLDIAFPGYGWGGLFGGVTGTVKNLNVSGTISDAWTAGILAASVNGGTIDCCSASGTITGKYDIGGLVGYFENGCIKNSYAVTDVKNTSSNEGDGCGGLVGDMYGNTTVASISCSYAAGKVVKTGASGVGGLVGYRHTRNYYGDGTAPIIASYYDMTTSTMTDLQKGFGVSTEVMQKRRTYANWDFDNIWEIDSSINSGYPYLKLSGECQTFELEGSGTDRDPYVIYTEAELAAVARGEITNCFSSSYELGNDIVLSSDYWTPIGGNGMDLFTGTFDGNGHKILGLRILAQGFGEEGLFGRIGTNGTVKNLGVKGSIQNASTAGLLAGKVEGGTVENCYSEGQVSGAVDIGGLLGYLENGTVKDSYSKADAAISSSVENDGCGGLVGNMYGNTTAASITNSYATGTVSKPSSNGIGGLVGYKHTRNYYGDGSATITSSFYNNYSDASTDKGTYKSTDDMKLQSTYTGWDFDDTWMIDSDKNDGYPFLQVLGIYKPAPVESVALNKASTSIQVGKTERLTAFITPSYADNQNVTWSSSDEEVAIVEESGLVKAIAEGSATITVTTEDGEETASCIVTVVPAPQKVDVTGVTLNKSTLSLAVGGTETLTATIEPADATVKNVTWSSDKPSVASVSRGKVTAKAEGTAVITVKTSDGGMTATCTVTVTAAQTTVAVTGITLNKTTLSLEAGKTETLTATIAPANATNKGVTWSSSKTSVATVANGVVTAVAQGTAVITATADGGKKATCTVTVTAATVAVTGITLNKTEISLEAGKSETLTATIAPANATNKKVTWTSDKTSVATVANGVVKAVAEGTAVITATAEDGGSAATCTVTVTPKQEIPVTGIKLNKTELEIVVGSTETLTATVEPSDATNTKVTWNCDKPDIATVENGTVKAVAEGTAVITVTTEDGSKTASCVVTVKKDQGQGQEPDAAVRSITLNKASITLAIGGTESLIAVMQPAGTIAKDAIWTSGDEEIATVDDNGKVKGIKDGSTVITVTYSGMSDTCKVTVLDSEANAKVTSVSLDKTKIVLSVGETQQLAETVKPNNAQNKEVKWESSKPAVATVEKGLVKAIAKGTAIITVETVDGKKTAACTVTVTAADTPDDGETATDGIWVTSIPDYVYTGSAIKPEVEVFCGGLALAAGKDYTVSYKNNVKAGKASAANGPAVVVKGIGNYSGTVTTKFNITKVSTSDLRLASETFQAGKSYTPAVIYITEDDKAVMMKAGTDYTVKYDEKDSKPSKKAGAHTMTISAKASGNCEGDDVMFEYNVVSETVASIAKAKVKIGKMTFGGALPQTTLTVGGEELTADSDYKAVFTNIDKKGTGKVTFIGMNSYTGTLTKSFKVGALNLKDDDNNDIDVYVEPSVEYVKGGAKAAVSVVVNDTILMPGTDYTLTYAKNTGINSNPTVTIKGKGNYTGTIKRYFTITPKDLCSDDVRIFVSAAQKGKSPAVTIYDANGKKLSAGKDYKATARDGRVAIKGGSNNLYQASEPIELPYTGDVPKEMFITSAKLSSGHKLYYNGGQIEIEKDWLKVKAGKATLNTEDFEILDYVNNVGSGTATVAIGGTGDYSGVVFVTFKISSYNLASKK